MLTAASAARSCSWLSLSQAIIAIESPVRRARHGRFGQRPRADVGEDTHGTTEMAR
jgi:hypothetical protein